MYSGQGGKMNVLRQLKIFGLLLLLAGLLLTACGQAAPPAAEPAPTEPPAAEEAAVEEPAAAEAPTELKIALILDTAIESPWNTAFLQALERLQAEKPHGLTISYDLTESVAQPDHERVLREYANSGEYPIIWAHSAFSDAVGLLKDEYPELLWVVTGAGNSPDPVGGNVYWLDAYTHEPAYLMGIIAGMMTESNIIGAVAAFPFPNVNIGLNAFVAGAKSVNPEVEAKVTYIESWFDPPKAKESAEAQIAAGADFIYAERFGVFDAAAEKGILAFGNQVDQHDVAPEVVVTSAAIRFDPAAKFIIDEWWNYETQGTPYDAPQKPIIFFMKEGGSEIAPYYEFEDKLPPEVLEAVEKAQAEIMAGTLEVPINDAPFE
jgi:basic membrane lipoprotein Med (substrate-binding protein (PBP1-ABC) superfamily)